MILKTKFSMNEFCVLANKNIINGQLQSTNVAFNEKNAAKAVEMQQ